MLLDSPAAGSHVGGAEALLQPVGLGIEASNGGVCAIGEQQFIAPRSRDIALRKQCHGSVLESHPLPIPVLGC
jgi:hypothetical protein